MEKLKGKVAIVTGASSGMGKAIAILFAQQGASVVVADLRVEEVNQVVNSIKNDGGKASGFLCDVANESDVTQLVEAVMKEYGALDILVNNAGIMDDFYPVDQVTNEQWNRVMGVNVNGPFYACRLAVPIMLKQGRGSIVNISSVGGLEGSRAGAVYTTSKHAIMGLTKNIGFMYAQKGIRCNAIAPGGVNTNIGRNMKPHPFGYERAISGAGSMPRMGESDEIARLALFLASDDASFVNGAIVVADGGWTAY
jgi:NAD(P)-dependent dehydrogenase (short-subunit alcohol dehydrogenase family)